jgi:hypothetical protein
MPKTTQIEVWAVIDEDGDYAVGACCDSAAERYAEDVGGDAGTRGIRRVKLLVTVPLPEPIVLTGEVTEAEEVAGLRVA